MTDRKKFEPNIVTFINELYCPKLTKEKFLLCMNIYKYLYICVCVYVCVCVCVCLCVCYSIHGSKTLSYYINWKLLSYFCHWHLPKNLSCRPRKSAKAQL